MYEHVMLLCTHHQLARPSGHHVNYCVNKWRALIGLRWSDDMRGTVRHVTTQQNT